MTLHSGSRGWRGLRDSGVRDPLWVLPVDFGCPLSLSPPLPLPPPLPPPLALSAAGAGVGNRASIRAHAPLFGWFLLTLGACVDFGWRVLTLALVLTFAWQPGLAWAIVQAFVLKRAGTNPAVCRKVTNLPGHLWRDTWTALSGPLSTLNPKHQVLNPEPSTLNPRP